MKKIMDLKLEKWTDEELKFLLDEVRTCFFDRGYSTEEGEIQDLNESLQNLQDDLDAILEKFSDIFMEKNED